MQNRYLGNKEYQRIKWVVEQITRIINTTPVQSEAIKKILELTYDPRWTVVAQKEAYRIVKEISVKNAESWRIAARKARTKGPLIQKSLNETVFNSNTFASLIENNAQMIQSIPQSVAKDLLNKVTEEVSIGGRGEDLIKELATQVGEKHARLIVRTEIAKTQAAITQIRAQKIGLNFYVWQTAEDQRVRSSHKHMHGVICDFNNPPAPEIVIGEKSQGNYNPGNIYNCRCFAEPVIDVDFLDAPYKYYSGGQIKTVNRRQLEEILSIKQTADIF